MSEKLEKVLCQVKEELLNISKRIEETKEEVVKMNDETEESDSHLYCSISGELFYKPVTTMCGHTFNQDAIQKALLNKSCCPLCRTELNLSDVYQTGVNVLIAEMVDKKYPLYRKDKIEKKRHLRHDGMLEMMTIHKQQKNIDRVKRFIKNTFEYMSENAVKSCAPRNRGDWDDILDLITKNVYVQNYCSSELIKVGYVLEYGRKRVNVVGKDEPKNVYYNIRLIPINKNHF